MKTSYDPCALQYHSLYKLFPSLATIKTFYIASNKAELYQGRQTTLHCVVFGFCLIMQVQLFPN